MFHSVELRTYCHATEDEERVRRALRTLAPDCDPSTERLEGAHGNPILLLTCRLERREAIEGFWRRVRDAGALPQALEGIADRMDDDAVLHLRFAKQRAFVGGIELARDDDAIAVRAKVVAHPAKKGAAVKAAREYLGGL